MNKIRLLLFALLFLVQNLDAQVDTVPPVLVCKNLTVVLLGPLCYSTFYAVDYIDTVYDNSQYYELGLRKTCTGSGFPQHDLVFMDASEAGNVSVEVWARDSSGNTASCQTSFTLFDHNGNCDPASILTFKTPEQDGIDSVVTHVKGNNCQFDSIDYKIPSNQGWGISWFSSMPGRWLTSGGFVPAAGYTYDLIPARNNDPLNGVTTYDLTLISKHILGITPLDSPYKIIAADANQDGKVTTFDMLILRKLILGNIDELPNGKSWRFIPANYVFPNPNDPNNPPFPEKITVSNTYDYITGSYQFLGIKIGDVNFTADPN